jgi:hypothetical protein
MANMHFDNALFNAENGEGTTYEKHARTATEAGFYWLTARAEED